ncbi:hypothetical protein FRC01_012872 [Tulasnella sp. 417]|nr:hypothetical protein FRC01_012872 [Tulasnella sp. 417]
MESPKGLPEMALRHRRHAVLLDDGVLPSSPPRQLRGSSSIFRPPPKSIFHDTTLAFSRRLTAPGADGTNPYTLENFGGSISHEFISPRLAHHPAPNVEAIKIHLAGIIRFTLEPIILLGGQTQNVREGSISCVPLRWAGDLFRSLRVLKLHGSSLGIRMEHVLSFLAQSPFLEILDLRSIDNLDTTLDTIHHNLPLLRLRSLTFIRCSGALARGIFCHATVSPDLSSLNVGLSDVMPDGEQFLTEASGFFQPVLQSAHRASSGSILRVTGQSLHLTMAKDSRDDQEPWVHISISQVSTSFACSWIDETLEIGLHPELGVELVIEPGALPVLDAHSLSNMGSTLCVTKLSISANYLDSQALLRLLGGGYGFGTSSPSLPSLQELKIASPEWEDRELLQAVRKRFSARDRSPDQTPDLTIFIARDNLWPGIGLVHIMDMTTAMDIREVKGFINTDSQMKPEISLMNHPAYDALTQKEVPSTTQISPFIHLLPPEILIEVLHHSLASDSLERPLSPRSARSYYIQLQNLRTVCKDWMTIVDGAPSFWTIVSSRVPRQVNSAALLRSSGCPLIVQVLEPSRSTRPEDSQLLQLMAPIRSRWKRLAVRSTTYESLHGWLAIPAPNVEKLDAKFIQPVGATVDPMILFGGETRNIREVSIDNVEIQWSGGIFIALRVLKLHNICQDMKTGHVLSFLAGSPSLKILELSDIDALPDPTLPIIPQTIALPYLHTLVVDRCSEELTSSVLMCITPPPRLSRLTVYLFPHYRSAGDRFLADTSALLQPILRYLHKVSSASLICVTGDEFEWLMAERESRSDVGVFYNLFIGGGSPSFALRWVDQTLQVEMVGDLEVELEIGSPSRSSLDEGMLASLGAMLCVTTLRIYGHRPDVQALFQLLGGEHGLQASPPSLPHLQKLKLLGFDWEGRELLSAVQRRFSIKNHGPDQLSDLELHINPNNDPNRHTPFSIMDIDTVAAIREVKGVRRLTFAAGSSMDGMTAISWSDESNIPVRGG